MGAASFYGNGIWGQLAGWSPGCGVQPTGAAGLTVPGARPCSGALLTEPPAQAPGAADTENRLGVGAGKALLGTGAHTRWADPGPCERRLWASEDVHPSPPGHTGKAKVPHRVRAGRDLRGHCHSALWAGGTPRSGKGPPRPGSRSLMDGGCGLGPDPAAPARQAAPEHCPAGPAGSGGGALEAAARAIPGSFLEEVAFWIRGHQRQQQAALTGSGWGARAPRVPEGPERAAQGPARPGVGKAQGRGLRGGIRAPSPSPGPGPPRGHRRSNLEAQAVPWPGLSPSQPQFPPVREGSRPLRVAAGGHPGAGPSRAGTELGGPGLAHGPREGGTRVCGWPCW